MIDTYSLTVINNSELRTPTFAVFAVLPEFKSPESISLAWLTQRIDNPANYTFDWEMGWEFAWEARGTGDGHKWSGSASLKADPGESDQCKASFDYDGATWSLTYLDGVPDLKTLRIVDTARIPRPSVKPSSVGIKLNGKAVCAIDAGPNLEQVFTLHPTYYINAGTYVEGQMLSAASITAFQELAYTGGNHDLTATLTASNKWVVRPSSTVNFARELAAASA
jgi:rhizosphere induced protein